MISRHGHGKRGIKPKRSQISQVVVSESPRPTILICSAYGQKHDQVHDVPARVDAMDEEFCQTWREEFAGLDDVCHYVQVGADAHECQVRDSEVGESIWGNVEVRLGMVGKDAYPSKGGKFEGCKGFWALEGEDFEEGEVREEWERYGGGFTRVVWLVLRGLKDGVGAIVCPHGGVLSASGRHGIELGERVQDSESHGGQYLLSLLFGGQLNVHLLADLVKSRTKGLSRHRGHTQLLERLVLRLKDTGTPKLEEWRGELDESIRRVLRPYEEGYGLRSSVQWIDPAEKCLGGLAPLPENDSIRHWDKGFSEFVDKCEEYDLHADWKHPLRYWHLSWRWTGGSEYTQTANKDAAGWD